jgi:hypothetical protein
MSVEHMATFLAYLLKTQLQNELLQFSGRNDFELGQGLTSIC